MPEINLLNLYPRSSRPIEDRGARKLSGEGWLAVESQVPLPVTYESVKLDVGYRLDLLVEDSVIIELKAIEKLLPIHEAQILSYLKLSGKRIGLLINFNVLQLKDGIKRRVNG